MGTPPSDKISQLRNLLDKDPHDAFCMYGIAMEHAKAGIDKEAIAWFDRTMETDTVYCYAWYQKARCQEHAGDTNGATETLQEGIENAKQIDDLHAAGEMEELLQSIQ